jgi:hypothetical protein
VKSTPETPSASNQIEDGGIDRRRFIQAATAVIGLSATGCTALQDKDLKDAPVNHLDSPHEVEQDERLKKFRDRPDIPKSIHIQVAQVSTSNKDDLVFHIRDTDGLLRYTGRIQQDSSVLLFQDNNLNKDLEREETAIVLKDDDAFAQFLRDKFEEKDPLPGSIPLEAEKS